MGQAVEVSAVAVSGESDLWDYLAAQPAKVSGVLAYRAALRALADVTRFEALDEASARYTLAGCRAALTAGVLLRKPDEKVRAAAAQAAKGTAPVRATHRRLMDDGAAAADGMVRVISALEAALARDDAAAAELAGHAMMGDIGCYDDCDLERGELLTAPISLPAMQDGLRDQLAAGDPWAFWRAWHEEALAGRPLPFSLQAEIARLPQDAWEAGPSVIAGRIGRIFARIELQTRIEQLLKRMEAHPEPDQDEEADGDDLQDDHAAASFGAVRLIREPVEDLYAQLQSPKPQPFLIQKATVRLTTVLAASGKWLGRSAEGEIKDMVRMIGKGGGVATATWIDGQSNYIRAVIRAADDWRHRLPA